MTFTSYFNNTPIKSIKKYLLIIQFYICILVTCVSLIYLHNRFFFDFSTTYVGVGMICPYIINVSLLVGGIISWAIMWPLIDNKKGDWYSAKLEQSSLHGLQGYKVSCLPRFKHNYFQTCLQFELTMLLEYKYKMMKSYV